METALGTSLVEASQVEIPQVEIPTELNLPEIPEFEGSRNKMEVLNNGELDSEGNSREVAVPFQLKEGSQGFTFALGIDKEDGNRVINLENLDEVAEMSEKEFSESAILQQVGDSLSILREGQDEKTITKEDLMDGPCLIPLNNKTAVEVVRFDPEKNEIVIRKQKMATEFPPASVIPPEVHKGWRQRFIDIVGL